MCVYEGGEESRVAIRSRITRVVSLVLGNKFRLSNLLNTGASVIIAENIPVVYIGS